MASSSSTADAALAGLTPSQIEALHQFTAVTDQQPAAALPILRRSQWNVQIAIAKFFDGETADPVAEAIAAQEANPAPASGPSTQTSGRTTSRHRPRLSSRRGTSSDITPAPRIVPTPSSTVIRRSILLSILFLPLSVLYKILSSGFSLFSVVFPFLRPLQRSLTQGTAPRHRTTSNPRDTAARFIREFEESTGIKDLPWFEGGYAQAMDLAKKDVRILMVILQSDEHDDTLVFNKETLGNPDVVAWIRDNNIVLWGASVSESEGYQVSASLNTTAFPFLALISLTPPPTSASSSSTTTPLSQSSSSATPTTMSTILRISGLLPPHTLLQKLNTATATHTAALDRIRAVRQTQLADRQIREQQNSAYELSLARDRERARIRREEEARALAVKLAQEKKAADARNARRRGRAWRRRMARAGLLPAEPPASAPAARISIRFPDGQRLVRRFGKETTIEEVYAWVECRDVLFPEGMSEKVELEEGGEEDVELTEEEEESLLAGYEHTYAFRLVSPMPRRVFESGKNMTINDGGLWPSANLIVEEVDEDDDEEEEESEKEEMFSEKGEGVVV
ncbi:hypothetical protein DFH27DRAFT_598121 [Peziza echinospora]|nr:hypothetical protein DFH27DRAFT_598121 [Peziza echinospora]